MPEASVIQDVQVLLVMTGCKGYVGGFIKKIRKTVVKKQGIMGKEIELGDVDRVDRMDCVMIKYEKIVRTFKAKAVYCKITDAEVRKNREQRGLETLVVYSVNDDY